MKLISRIWYGGHRAKSATFYSDVDPLDGQPLESPQSIQVSRDISTVEPGDYAAVIMSANYTSVRLRYSDQPRSVGARALVQSAPAVAWFAKAMHNPRVIKGALCHGHDDSRRQRAKCNNVLSDSAHVFLSTPEGEDAWEMKRLKTSSRSFYDISSKMLAGVCEVFSGTRRQ